MAKNFKGPLFRRTLYTKKESPVLMNRNNLSI